MKSLRIIKTRFYLLHGTEKKMYVCSMAISMPHDEVGQYSEAIEDILSDSEGVIEIDCGIEDAFVEIAKEIKFKVPAHRLVLESTDGTIMEFLYTEND